MTYSLDFLHNLDTRAMRDPGAILGVDDNPEKISDQVLFALPQIIAPKPIHRGRDISPWAVAPEREVRPAVFPMRSRPGAIFPRSPLLTPLRKAHAEAKGIAQVVDIYS